MDHPHDMTLHPRGVSDVDFAQIFKALREAGRRIPGNVSVMGFEIPQRRRSQGRP
jgi:hypothetical protein